MDRPVREKLLLAFMAVTLASGVLTIGAGSYLLNTMVIQEAQRRVSLGLKTARAMLDRRGDELMRAAGVIAHWLSTDSDAQIGNGTMAVLREKSGGDYVDVVDRRGVVIAGESSAIGFSLNGDSIVRTAIEEGRASVGVRVMGSRELSIESPRLAAQAYIPVLPTPRAKPGGPEEIRGALVIEAAYPVVKEGGAVAGAVRVGIVLNRNFELVDFIRENIFTVATYKGKQLGTVTIFLRDVRIATNVIGPNGERAIGTRVSAEVYDKVLERGEVWIGPAFVVDNWYMSAYEPIRDVDGQIVGILYVGVLKDRYDDMRRWALGVFLGIVLISLLVAASVSTFLAGRIARPIKDLTEAASRIARGDFDVEVGLAPQANRDELKKLRAAFMDMVNALRQRDEEIRRSQEELRRTAEELRRWNQNYLDTLEFITHELKNQIAAMKLNLLAVRDGFVGGLSAEQREAIDDVVQAVNRTEEMILN
ncbi:MAG: cache domain-containing protein, partial [Armatimonadetes bacterium]|nr:cache domain-containing protein [Armatimonadota bacterium]